MSSWQRLVPLEASSTAVSTETWRYAPKGGKQIDFPMTVTNGKKFDVLSLKGTDLQETREYSDFLNETSRKLYDDKSKVVNIQACPCCGAPTAEYCQETDVFVGVSLSRCQVCRHGFFSQQPKEEVLSEVFAESETHSSIYVDMENVDARMKEIIAPKAQWSLDLYSSLYNAMPRDGIDVGAGGGHFVEGLLRRGVKADGYEISRASRAFAKKAFDLDLISDDFLLADGEKADLITFWGLLEYTPKPRAFLEAARRMISDKGMLVVEVPRVDCFGTAVQSENPNSIARHIDPTSHVNTFSDASLATALVETGFRPVAAWYFGMDVYELLVQAALRLGDASVIDKLADMVPRLQHSLDLGRQCDDLVVAAVPITD
tara:strand:+ start:135 stop:1256 length:1122 start_codon:yes stop_codon:yes gene_type:complete